MKKNNRTAQTQKKRKFKESQTQNRPRVNTPGLDEMIRKIKRMWRSADGPKNKIKLNNTSKNAAFPTYKNRRTLLFEERLRFNIKI